jgi:UDP-N-acetylglucosamine 2-epimerase (non-hydrolysing)
VSRRSVFVTFGTRPEAIKMAPVVLELTSRGLLDVFVCLTGQHRKMLDQVVDTFSLPVDHDLRIMQDKQSLGHITAAVLKGLDPIMEKVRPDVVLVHGDTTTTFAAALAAFYRMIPVAHVEAGLRTSDIYNPYPEEINRRLADRLAVIHYAPTEAAAEALRREGMALLGERTALRSGEIVTRAVDGPHPGAAEELAGREGGVVSPGKTGTLRFPAQDLLVTGNTVIDALLTATQMPAPPLEPRLSEALRRPGPKVLVTVHRRESWGTPMERVARAIERASREVPSITFVFPIHLNPVVRKTFKDILAEVDQVVFCEPLSYLPFVHLMRAVDLVLTDSGGLQEEAPSLGKPVLVMRKTTERPEGIAAGTGLLIGTETEAITAALLRLLRDRRAYERMARAVNPYGDGHAAERIADHLEFRFGLRRDPPEPFRTERAGS